MVVRNPEQPGPEGAAFRLAEAAPLEPLDRAHDLEEYLLGEVFGIGVVPHAAQAVSVHLSHVQVV